MPATRSRPSNGMTSTVWMLPKMRLGTAKVAGNRSRNHSPNWAAGCDPVCSIDVLAEVGGLEDEVDRDRSGAMLRRPEDGSHGRAGECGLGGWIVTDALRAPPQSPAVAMAIGPMSHGEREHVDVNQPDDDRQHDAESEKLGERKRRRDRPGACDRR